MFHTIPFLLLFLRGIALITGANFDFSVTYRIENDPRLHQFKRGNKITEELGNATEITLNQKVPIILRRLDLSFVKNLSALTMNDCDINDIEVGSLKNLDSLKFLNITNNPIKVIKDGIFNHMSVAVLNLAHNKLTTIRQGAFDDMPQLEHVILDYNELTFYSYSFRECPKLVTISAQYNFIQYLPPNIFENLIDHKLIVHFSYNKIKIIHEDIFDVEEYDELYLDHNDLTEFDFRISKVGVLSLQHNYIDCLEDSYIRNELRKVRRVFLDDNPINCTCYETVSRMDNILVSDCVDDEEDTD